jgi:hypothetical protein
MLNMSAAQALKPASENVGVFFLIAAELPQISCFFIFITTVTCTGTMNI